MGWVKTQPGQGHASKSGDARGPTVGRMARQQYQENNELSGVDAQGCVRGRPLPVPNVADAIMAREHVRRNPVTVTVANWDLQTAPASFNAIFDFQYKLADLI